MDPTAWTIIVALAGALVSLAGWSWKRELNARTREDALQEKLRASEIKGAISDTKLAAYGESAPELAEKVDRLAELMLHAISGQPMEEPPKQLPWPSMTKLSGPKR